MGRLIEDTGLRHRSPVFKDRADAGRRLAENLREYTASGALVLAIPAGGVPVAYEIAIIVKDRAPLLPLRFLKLAGSARDRFDPALNYAFKLFLISSENSSVHVFHHSL